MAPSADTCPAPCAAADVVGRVADAVAAWLVLIYSTLKVSACVVAPVVATRGVA
jgi:hypothetical protein